MNSHPLNVLQNPRACVVLSLATATASVVLLWEPIQSALGFAVIVAVHFLG